MFSLTVNSFFCETVVKKINDVRKEQYCYSYVDLYLFELSRFDFTPLLAQHI